MTTSRLTEADIAELTSRPGGPRLSKNHHLSSLSPAPQAAIAPKKRSKMGNEKCSVDGYSFDSKREMGRYLVLKLRKAAGEIYDLELQVDFELMRTPIKEVYRADFTYYEKWRRIPSQGDKTGDVFWQFIVEDAKGFKTKTYVRKRRLMKIVFGITIRET